MAARRCMLILIESGRVYLKISAPKSHLDYYVPDTYETEQKVIVRIGNNQDSLLRQGSGSSPDEYVSIKKGRSRFFTKKRSDFIQLQDRAL
jgi:hypothetical protein